MWHELPELSLICLDLLDPDGRYGGVLNGHQLHHGGGESLNGLHSCCILSLRFLHLLPLLYFGGVQLADVPGGLLHPCRIYPTTATIMDYYMYNIHI